MTPKLSELKEVKFSLVDEIEKLKTKHHKSVFQSETELLACVLDIHNEGKMVDCDPMFFKGNFYKDGLDMPNLCFDKNPQEPWIVQADAQNLPLESNTLKSIILDPPFMIGNRNSQQEYYSSKTHTIMKDFAEMESLYRGILKEAHRVLKKDGLLVFKCQDYTDSKTVFTHTFVQRWAEEQGFYAKDLAILVKPNKITNPNTKQRHLRKIHTYFWVFIKKLVTK